MNCAVTSNSTMMTNRWIVRSLRFTGRLLRLCLGQAALVPRRAALRRRIINIQASKGEDDAAGKASLRPFSARLSCDGLHEIVRDLGRIVTRHSVFFQVVTQHWYDAERLNRVEIILDLARPLQYVFGFHFSGSRCAVEERIVEDLLLRMAIQCLDVI